jgi:hypothetical protein
MPTCTCTAAPDPWSSSWAAARTEWLAARLEDLDYGYIDGIAADPSHRPAQPGSEPNPDARIADGSVTDTARRGDLL